MTAPSDIRLTSGLRAVQMFALDTNGFILPSASGSAGRYTGTEISGAHVWEFTEPEPRKITHVGDDRVIAVDFLPPQDGISGNLRTGKVNDVVDALVNGITAVEAGEKNFLLINTDQRGNEPQVGMMVYAQSLDDATGGRVWDGMIFPKAQLYALESGFGGEAKEKTYAFVPAIVTKHIWGSSFSSGSTMSGSSAGGGARTAQGVRFVSKYRPRLIGYSGDGSADTFPFETDKQAVDVNKVLCWIDGVLTTPSSVTTAQVVLSAPLGSGKNLTVFYEYA